MGEKVVSFAFSAMLFAVCFSAHAQQLARCEIRGKDPERNEARRPPRGAANEVRVHHQSKSSQADRLDDPS